MSNYLIHYGVKGMKWGVRRDKEELDRLAGRAYKVDYESDENTLKVTKVSELPDPSFYSEEWSKIKREAEEAKKSTEEYHKKMGIK